MPMSVNRYPAGRVDGRSRSAPHANGRRSALGPITRPPPPSLRRDLVQRVGRFTACKAGPPQTAIEFFNRLADPAATWTGGAMAPLTTHCQRGTDTQQPEYRRGRHGGVHITATIGLVARDAELAAVVAELERTRSGACRSVLIRGDAGTGKSRLLDELLDARSRRPGSPRSSVEPRITTGGLPIASLRLALHDRLAERDEPTARGDRAARLDALLFGGRLARSVRNDAGPCSTSSTRSSPGGPIASRSCSRSTTSTAPIPRRWRRSRSSLATWRAHRVLLAGDRPLAAARARSRRRRRHRSVAGVELDDGRRPRCAARSRSRGADPVDRSATSRRRACSRWWRTPPAATRSSRSSSSGRCATTG